MTSVHIRDERPEDRAPVQHVNEAAFGGAGEAELVRALHAAGAARVALVAELEGELVGHILFSDVTLEPSASLKLAGLAPMAVLPAHQRNGIGSSLVREGLERLRAKGYDAVVVLGHPAYYPRFGFVPATRFGLRSKFAREPEHESAFMALELRPGALSGVSGEVHYRPEFDGF